MSAFEVIYQGADDQAPETLQRIKGVFVADLEFPIEDVQRFLQLSPVSIHTGDNEEDANHIIDSLKSVGAKVLLVRHQAQEREADEIEQASNDSDELIFELDLSQPSTLQQQPEAPKKVYELPESSSQDNQALFAELNIETPKAEEQSNGDLLFSPAQVQKPQVIPDASLAFHDELASATEETSSSLVQSSITDSSMKDQVHPHIAPPKHDFNLSLDESSAQNTEDKVISGPVPKVQTSELPVKPELKEENDLKLGPASEIVNSTSDYTQPASPIVSAQQTRTADLPAAQNTQQVEQEEELPLAEQIKKMRENAATELEEEDLSNESATQEVEQSRMAPPLTFKRATKEIIIPLAVGSAMLLLGNWVYSHSRGDSEYSLPSLTSLLTAPFDKAEEPPPSEPVVDSLFKGEQTTANYRVEGELEAAGTTALSFSCKLFWNKPAELSKEEIIHKVIREPWLYQVEIEKQAFQAATKDPAVLIGRVKVNYEYNKLRRRTLSPIKVTLLNINAESVKVSLEIGKASEENSADLGEITPTIDHNGLLSFASRVEMVLNRAPLPVIVPRETAVEIKKSEQAKPKPKSTTTED